MIDTQDVVKTLDITGLTTVTGSELNQLVDTARLGSNKGLIIETTDTALDTPEVPDPNGNYTGVLPIWWKRYIWRRLSFDNLEVKNYIWDESGDEDETLLFWILIDKAGIEALDIANTALTNAAAAQATANTAQTNAANAQITADNAQADTDVNTSALNLFQISLQELEDRQLALWAAGDLKHTCRTTLYSITENQQWLECDGSAVDRVVFADLFAAIGTTWGPGDNITTFNVPDFRGRCLVGAGTGAGLTVRNMGLTNFGEETHLLTALESGLPTHNHSEFGGAVGTEAVGGGGADRRTFGAIADPGVTDMTTNTGNVVAAPASQAHNIMQPSGVARIIIKT